ncbi:type III-B CRISPR-associated protein Cas10/Cmr2 [Marinimicrobium sp. ARAG 43.8]|uniref:type III-B CRISPR-associated protein Cas10/Cmr2 n=1 Tax=Marinimicrobium sp. ARAG 43.8 TaxID=3418719 RepID=UPI003CF6246C
MSNPNEKSNNLWQTKLAARIHDPAEKALVLLRDPAGHEGGTSRALTRLLGFHEINADSVDSDNDEALTHTLFKKGIPADMYRHVQRADWWAAAADRPQWPVEEWPDKQGVMRIVNWAQAHWAKEPVLIHPLTGEQFDLGKSGGLSATAIEAVKTRSFDHFSELMLKLGVGKDDQQDWRKLLLTFWRFGPELGVTDADTEDNDKLGKLWEVLPSDTRIPDHSIWDHLDLTSAFAGAFAADPDGEVALLSLAIGPVQPFIAAARKTDDLWAGSHLLSRLSWEAMRPVCERLGPDAILFPRLRGIPQVDLWLRDQMQLPDELFKDCDWMKGGTDSNPLFSAAFPNRFVAVVPASQAKAIAETAEKNVRKWLQGKGEEVVIRLLSEAGYSGEQENITTPFAQMKEQLAGFPEVHWAAVPFSVIHCRDKKKQCDLDITQLSESMKPFFEGEGEPGFLNTPAWKVLQKKRELLDDDGRKKVFFAPNPGVLYPAVFDLAERVLAAAKASRTFAQMQQKGWRCSLTGEAEWLTTDREQLHWNQHYRQKQGTLWTAIADKKLSWAKKDEHLSALPAIKRLWPTLFKEEVGKALAAKDDGSLAQIDRFVVSTHTMALAHQLANKLDISLSDELKDTLQNQPRVALPRKLAKKIHSSEQAALIARIPGWLESARDEDDDGKALEQAQRGIRDILGQKAETYYSLLMMDGDKMGAILSGDENTQTVISYQQSFHPEVQKGFAQRAEKQADLKAYGGQKRAISPNRHLAISGALNDFSQTVVRHVVEEEHLGRLIYAGGDDVQAMLPVVDLLPAMQRLRHAYSGTVPEDEPVDWGELRKRNTLVCKGGFAWLKGRLMRMMGQNATASCGAIIAHHQAPLSAVMRELRAAEQRAKNEGGRDAFSITIVKRSGGALYLTEKWGEPVALLNKLRDFLTQDGVSRRAVYHTLQWLNESELPDNAFDASANEKGMAHSLLAYQLDRQAQGEAKQQTPELAERLITLAQSWPAEKRIEKLRNFLCVAEFLARETRTDSTQEGDA